MAKYITKTVSGIESKGIEVHGVFITKAESGEYIAYDKDNNVVSRGKKQKEVIDACTPSDPVHIEIYVAPPNSKLPRGQIYQFALKGDKIIKSNMTMVTSTKEADTIAMETIHSSTDKGLKWSLPKTVTQLHYIGAQNAYYRNPAQARDMLIKAYNGTEKKQEQQDNYDLPF